MLLSKALIQISIGMAKQTVIDLISEPDIVRGSMIDKSTGYAVEVWEYNVERRQMGLMPYYTESYWLCFHDNKLVQWGRAGDWNEVKNIQEIRFR